MWRWDQQEPFGDSVPNEDPDGDSIAFSFPMRFPGQYADSETGTAYNFFRDYDPRVGRYVQAEPLGVYGDINLYRYAKVNPLVYVDVNGFWPGEPGPVGTNLGSRLGNTMYTGSPYDYYYLDTHEQCEMDCLVTLAIGTAQHEGAVHVIAHTASHFARSLARLIARASAAASVASVAAGSLEYQHCVANCGPGSCRQAKKPPSPSPYTGHGVFGPSRID